MATPRPTASGSPASTPGWAACWLRKVRCCGDGRQSNQSMKEECRRTMEWDDHICGDRHAAISLQRLGYLSAGLGTVSVCMWQCLCRIAHLCLVVLSHDGIACPGGISVLWSVAHPVGPSSHATSEDRACIESMQQLVQHVLRKLAKDSTDVL